MLTVGSLFAGIGGLELGLERTGGFKTVWQVELDPYARRVLEKHWPGVRRWDDVKTFPPTEPSEWSCDVVAFGSPCQGFSNAGKKRGLEDDRSALFFDAIRVVRTLRPRYAVMENVAAVLYRGMGDILREFSESGYDAEWEVVPASAFGAHHIRERLFIVAYCPDSVSVRSQRKRKATQGPWSGEQFARLVQAELQVSVPAGKSGGISHGVRHRKHRLRCLGNAVVPQVAEFIGRMILDMEAST